MGNKKPTNSKRSPRGDSPVSRPQKKDAGLNVYMMDTAWRVALPLLGFSFFGYWLDLRQDTKPLFSLIGLFVGIAATVMVMYKFLEVNFPETLDMIRGKDASDTTEVKK